MPSASSAQAPAASLPSAADVFVRYTNAIGGASAIKKHRSRRIVGRFELTAQATTNLGAAGLQNEVVSGDYDGNPADDEVAVALSGTPRHTATSGRPS